LINHGQYLLDIIVENKIFKSFYENNVYSSYTFFYEYDYIINVIIDTDMLVCAGIPALGEITHNPGDYWISKTEMAHLPHVRNTVKKV